MARKKIEGNPIEQELAYLVSRYPKLPEEVRRAILALIDAVIDKDA